ncbi:MAG: hypothetical protein M3220_03105 [Chloroflexota bacterium]|nr:hypothetical protein [Chloroflexota bacterium]
MNQLSVRDLQQHVTILGWLHILGHAIFLLIGGFVFILLTSIGAVSGDADAVAVLGIVATFVAGLLTVLALPGMLAGYGLLKRKEWGRILALVVGFLNLANFPIGTAIGLYTFWVLLQESANEYFSSSVPAQRWDDQAI